LLIEKQIAVLKVGAYTERVLGTEESVKSPRSSLLTSVVILAGLVAFLPAQENSWTSHGPRDIGWITDVAIAGSTAFAATLNGVYRSDDGGVTWRPSGLAGEPVGQIVAGTGASALFARAGQGPWGGPRGVLYVSRDGGQSWTPALAQEVYTVALDPADSSTVYAATVAQQITKSSDAGASWQMLSTTPGDGYGEFFAFDATGVYLLTAFSGLFKSTDNGASWASVPPPRDGVVVVSGGGKGALYAVAQPNDFCRSDDGAATWSCSSFVGGYVSAATRIVELPNEASGVRSSILASSPTGLFLSRDGGGTWTATQALSETDGTAPHGIASNEAGSLVLAGSEQGSLASVDRGSTWTASRTGLQSAWIEAVAADPQDAGRIWAEGSGTLFRSNDGGASWSTIHDTGSVPYGAIAIDPERPSTVYVGSDRVSRTEDGGASWRSFTIPGHLVISLALDPASPRRVLAGTGSGLHLSEDGAQTWSPSPPIAQAIYSILFDRARPDTIYAGSFFDYNVDYPTVYGGAIFISHDRGRTFTKNATEFSGNVIALAQDAVDASVLYGATYTSFVRSDDGGVHWHDTGARPPHFIEALIADPVLTGRLYAGTSEGVYRTVDGGQTWDVLASGLPNSEVTSLAISADGKTLHAGTRGGGVFDLDLRIPPSPCTASATRLCLVGNRYAVDLLATHDGMSSPGIAHGLSDRAGFFSLPFATGDPDLPEVAVKMLPGGAFGGSGAPIFYSSLTTLPFVLTVTDTATGDRKAYASHPGAPLCGGADLSFADAAAPSTNGIHPSAARQSALPLLGGRFSITLQANRPGSSQVATGLAISSGDRFGFFSLPALTGDAEFPEVVVKMLDARALTGKFWFFHASLTSLEYTLTVRDSVTGAVRVYRSGKPFCGSADGEAFDDSPPDASRAAKWRNS